ncbi:MAG: ATP-binding cassette domain-containing protein [Candidatus Cloacimonetes bacterium]|nr:ATP-binding cassette domain-containing protein [Candidatus Cloacimonadota bacterium]
MSLISINEVSHNFGGHDIFENISFSLEHNSRIGLIGLNGSGKTTLFNILTGRMVPHTGTVQRARNLRIAYLSQEVELNEQQTLEECVSGAHEEFNLLHKNLEAARQAVAARPDESNMKKLQSLEENFFQAGGYHFAAEMKIVLAGLGFPLDSWQRKITDFSGGEKTRIQFARILLSPNDLFLLDEPTNHLDFAMIYWLESYLVKQDKPYLIISHDRHFLDKTVNKIAEIKNRRIFLTHGNYSIWEADRETRSLTQERSYKRQQKFIKKTEDFIAKNMAGQKVQQAKSRQRTLAKLEIIDKPEHEKMIKLSFGAPKRSGNDVVIFENAKLGYPGNILAHKVNLHLGYRNIVALVGANGSGKTTLLKCLRNELKPLAGKVKMGASLNIGYYDQMHTELNEDINVYETMQNLMPGATQGEILSWLARFSFTGDDISKLVKVLSGGEKARLYLARLIRQQPNFLILDEPTNHLDINTIEQLELALENYQGTVIFVSHDSYFIRRIAQRIWLIKDKTIKEIDADIEEIFNDSLSNQKAKKKQEFPEPRDLKKRINPQILEQMMTEINVLHQKIADIESEISDIESKYGEEKYYSSRESMLNLKAEHLELENKKSFLVRELEQKETAYLEKCEE